MILDGFFGYMYCILYVDRTIIILKYIDVFFVLTRCILFQSILLPIRCSYNPIVHILIYVFTNMRFMSI